VRDSITNNQTMFGLVSALILSMTFGQSTAGDPFFQDWTAEVTVRILWNFTNYCLFVGLMCTVINCIIAASATDHALAILETQWMFHLSQRAPAVLVVLSAYTCIFAVGCQNIHILRPESSYQYDALSFDMLGAPFWIFLALCVPVYLLFMIIYSGTVRDLYRSSNEAGKAAKDKSEANKAATTAGGNTDVNSI